MDNSADDSKGHVAIVGSGPAGLFAAWALQNGGYTVTIFEKSDKLALDGHSFWLNDSVIDIPMRTFSGKYYANLFQILEHLGIKIQIRRFQYTFMEKGEQYFQFFSNFHRVLPCLTNGIVVNLFIFCCYLWYTIAIFLFPPYIAERIDSDAKTESLDEYARRIRLPDVFLDRYLLPLLSSVATCGHNHLRNFPAAYIVGYRKGTLAAHHRTVSSMRDLQERLAKGIRQQLGSKVVSVAPDNGKVVVRYLHPMSKNSETALVKSVVFDHVILALSSCQVRVSVSRQSKEKQVIQRRNWPTEPIMLDTCEHPMMGTVTSSTHLHSNGAAVSVSAYRLEESENYEDDHALHVVNLTRPLPTPDSHNLLLAAFGKEKHWSDSKVWKNGDGNVYLAGGYASAGLPLLEACLRSALEAAESIGARIPFSIVRPTPF